jgi:type IV secretion system protein VirD4
VRNDRWTNSQDIKDILTLKTETNKACGPLLYREKGQNWFYNGEGHTLILGVSGSGKSRRGTIPMIRSFIDAEESFVVVDPKGEIHRESYCYLSQKGYSVHVIDFRHIFESECWNPLAAPYELFISHDHVKKQTAIEIIDEMSHALYPISSSSDPFWSESARSVFVGACFALFEKGNKQKINMFNVYHIIANGDERLGATNRLKEYVNQFSENSIPSMMLQSYLSTASDTKAGIRSVFLEGLSMCAKSEGLISMLSNDDVNINELNGTQATAIYVILPDESPIYDKLAGVLVSQLMSHFVRIAQDKHAGKLPRRLNFCLEELGNIGKAISNLPHLMSAGRSRNIRLQLVLQSLSQLTDLYGASNATTILSNADVTMAFRTNHWDTLTDLSLKCGMRDILNDGHIIHESLITQNQLGSLRTGQALVIISGATRFITSLQDYSEMFDNGEWTLPQTKNNNKIRHDINDSGKLNLEQTKDEQLFENSTDLVKKDQKLFEILDKLSKYSELPDNNILEIISAEDETKHYNAILISTGGNNSKIIGLMTLLLGVGEKEARKMTSSLPTSILSTTLHESAVYVRDMINESGGMVIICESEE